ncbi:MAG TPA: MBL fold metallo-hydrolase [Gemmatimonadaceae bacterium]|nr:MBL fold metallo-hydrolase [Gemmatimonadaceae bacterium]
MKVTYIGHATLLVEIGTVRLLTDPNFDRKLGGFLPRVSPPGIPIDRLPHLDALLLTHAHADHLSFASLEALPRDIPLYAPPVIAKWLRRRGYQHAEDLAPGRTVRVADVEVHAAIATHHGNRYGFDRWRGAANMYLLDNGDETCFFAGDTALMPDTHELVHEKLLPSGRRLDVALLPIGYAPWWKLTGFRRGHLTHDDALTLFERLRGRVFVPYHWGTFHHITARAHDAINRLVEHLESHHDLRAAVRILQPGETLELKRERETDAEQPMRRAADRAFNDVGEFSAGDRAHVDPEPRAPR